MSPADSLTRYREKRDFAQTPEPAGKAGQQGDKLSFVVQRHAASRLHYDLRLEWRGVMKSWAVTRGPSLDPADKRLAVEVEDHPLDYASFEGTIPKPAYGGGTVQVWDRGPWAPLDPATVDRDLEKGELKFVLSGERLKGGFVLVRLRPRKGESEKHHNWLLIKEKDSAATPGAGDTVLRAATSVLSGRTLDEIAAGADPSPAKAASSKPVRKKVGATSTEKPVAGVASTKAASRTPVRKKVGVKAASTEKPLAGVASTKAASRTPVRKKVGVKAASTEKPVAGVASTKAASRTPVRKKVEAHAASMNKPVAEKAAARKTAAKKAAVADMPRFVPPQLCKLVDTPPTGEHWVHELKLDGYRLQLRVENGKPVLRTRTGLDWTERFPAIAQAAASLPDCVMDGEGVALDAKGHPSFSALQATLAGEQRAPIVYFIFDLLHDGERDLRDEPLEERKRILKSIVPKKDAVLRYLDDFSGPGKAVLASACELSMEGIVSKRADSPYTPGRGDGWTKSKCRGRDEFIVGGWTKDKNSRGLGALLVGARRDDKLVYLGRVGTGFSARLGEDLLRRLAPLRAATSPFVGRQPERTSDVTWVTPTLVVEIAYGGWTEDQGLLRHASFQGIREDKPAVEVTSPADPRTSPAGEPAFPPNGKVSSGKGSLPVAVNANDARQRNHDSETATRAPRAVARQNGAVTISHPEKVLWPATATTPAVTKADLAAYYGLYADKILAQAGGRPLSVIRAPDGITGQLFFQRHAMRGQSPLIGAVTVAGQAQPYLRIDDVAGLTALAQISVVELHPWGARAETPDIPDRLIFDLDPAEGLNFDAVVEAGLDLRARLKTIGLASFPRVTGGKGLHVVVPLASPTRGSSLGWPEAKQFCRLVCVMMERDSPDRYTTTMAKKVRGGKIFLDYLRNDRLATAIAGWSPRGRPGAPVARPIPWSLVKPGLDPAGWRVADLLDAKPPRDPWGDFDAAAGDLRAAIARATKG